MSWWADAHRFADGWFYERVRANAERIRSLDDTRLTVLAMTQHRLTRSQQRRLAEQDEVD